MLRAAALLIASTVMTAISWGGADGSRPDSLLVLATGAAEEPLEALRTAAAEVAGLPLQVRYGSASGNLRQEILDGGRFDVAILTPAVIGELAVRDLIMPVRHVVARIPVMVGVRGDAPPLDVSTPYGLRQALLGADSVRYARTGTSRPTVDRVLTTLSIANSIRDTSQAATPAVLGPGKYEIRFFVASESRRNSDYRPLGRVIGPLEIPVVLEAVVSRKSGSTAAAQALIRYLEGPEFAAAIESAVR